MASSKSTQAKTLTDQIAALAKFAGIMEKALRNTGFAEFYTPAMVEDGDWDGDVLSIDDLGELFTRAEVEEQFNKVISDPEDAGVVGDLISILVQGDFLGQLERAYRARHMTSPRAKAHAAGRNRGHGHENGPMLLGMTNYIKQLLKLASG